VVVANLGRQVAVCGNEGGAKLGHKLFHGVTFVAKLLAAKVAVEAGKGDEFFGADRSTWDPRDLIGQSVN
jgi:hypothetical protein